MISTPNGRGPLCDISTTFSNALRLPVVPEIFGFDPRLQFTHEDDVTGALMHATLKDVPGIYNIAGDGAMPWSEVCTIVGITCHSRSLSCFSKARCFSGSGSWM